MEFHLPEPNSIRFIQKEPRRKDDVADLLEIHIYKFKSRSTKLNYIVRVEYYVQNLYVIKFYATQHKHHINKYNLSTNKGYVREILVTIVQLIPRILFENQSASFGMIGARSIDVRAGKAESTIETRRFRTYCAFVDNTIGDKTFKHYSYPKVSGYILLNRRNPNLLKVKESIEKMFIENYADIHAVL